MTEPFQPLEIEIVRHRRLLWMFLKHEVRARYVGSALGFFWAIIHPLILLGLYILVFSALMPSGSRLPIRDTTANYAVFLCPALFAWNWLYESLVSACHSVTSHSALIRKVVFPSGILPLVSVGVGILPFAVVLSVFILFALASGAIAAKGLFWLPLLVLLQCGLALGPAYLLAVMNVFLRDTAQVVVALLQVLFWATPIVYPATALTNQFSWLGWWFALNPVARLVEAYRDVIVAGRPPATESVLYLGCLAILLYYVGRTVFERSRSQLVDEA
ncbi:MAG: transport permease protein [Candidatus Sumerlaea sp.]|nr:MAG: transport permease protein [Candidatus Sumerlaea sp.]